MKLIKFVFTAWLLTTAIMLGVTGVVLWTFA